jgi:hypothetical protein
MFIPPYTEPSQPLRPHPENGLGQSVSRTAGISSASLMPTPRQTVNGVEVIHPGSALPQNYQTMPQARIYHPKQAPSAVMSENFLAARAALNPGFVQNTAHTNIARISNLYRDVPRFRNELDILV